MHSCFCNSPLACYHVMSQWLLPAKKYQCAFTFGWLYDNAAMACVVTRPWGVPSIARLAITHPHHSPHTHTAVAAHMPAHHPPTLTQGRRRHELQGQRHLEDG